MITPQTITTTETVALAIQNPLNHPTLQLFARWWDADRRKWIVVTDKPTRCHVVGKADLIANQNGGWSEDAGVIVTVDGVRYMVEARL